MQSFANTNSAVIDLGLPQVRVKGWAAFKPAAADPMEMYVHYLRAPGQGDGLRYRLMRVGVLAVLQARALVRKPLILSE